MVCVETPRVPLFRGLIRRANPVGIHLRNRCLGQASKISHFEAALANGSARWRRSGSLSRIEEACANDSIEPRRRAVSRALARFGEYQRFGEDQKPTRDQLGQAVMLMVAIGIPVSRGHRPGLALWVMMVLMSWPMIGMNMPHRSMIREVEVAMTGIQRSMLDELMQPRGDGDEAAQRHARCEIGRGYPAGHAPAS